MAGMTREDPELGTVKLCPTCEVRDPEGCAWWPLDLDFWYRFGTTWSARCRACWQEDTARRHAATRGEPRRHRDEPRKYATKRDADRAWYESLTPEQRQARIDRRRAWRHARSIAKSSLRTAYAEAEAVA